MGDMSYTNKLISSKPRNLKRTDYYLQSVKVMRNGK